MDRLPRGFQREASENWTLPDHRQPPIKGTAPATSHFDSAGTTVHVFYQRVICDAQIRLEKPALTQLGKTDMLLA